MCNRRYNYLQRVKCVQQLAAGYYERGRMDRCMAETWRRRIYPVYPMCYESFRRAMAVDVERELAALAAAQERQKKRPVQPYLFGV